MREMEFLKGLNGKHEKGGEKYLIWIDNDSKEDCLEKF